MAEDDKAIRDSIGIYLENANYQVFYAEDGREALKSERTQTELITNVCHDLKTPLTSIIHYAELLNKEQMKK